VAAARSRSTQPESAKRCRIGTASATLHVQGIRSQGHGGRGHAASMALFTGTFASGCVGLHGIIGMALEPTWEREQSGAPTGLTSASRRQG
jgi:hypothetical protein